MQVEAVLSAIEVLKGFAPRGCDCIFIKITDTVGAKLYRNFKKAENAMSMQRKFSTKNLAPKVIGDGAMFELDHNPKFPSYLYGYFTEVIEVLRSSEPCPADFDIRKRECLKKIKEAFNYEYQDNNYCNFGYLNGELVPIDFGESKKYWKA